jgi:hypothetical protein
MKVLFSIAALFGVLSVAQANSVVFNSPSALNSIDGNNYYTWGIGWTMPTGDQITGATLTFNNIQLTSFGNSNPGILWTHLLNTSTANGSITTGTDNDSATDAFAGSGLLLGKRLFPTLNTKATFSYNLDLATLTSYLSDGKFGIGIDPDCHYTDDSISLTITYASKPTNVPDATSTGLLLGSAFSLLALFRKKIASLA